MKDILIDLIDRLEKQNLLLQTLSDRIDVLEQIFDQYHPEAVDDRLRLRDETRRSSNGAREAIGYQHEEFRQAVSKSKD